QFNATIHPNVEVDFLGKDHALVISWDEGESFLAFLDLASGASGGIHEPPQTQVSRLTLSPDGRNAAYVQTETASGRDHGSVIVATYPEMKELWRFQSEKGSPNSIKWLPEKNRLFVQYFYPVQNIQYVNH